MLVKVKISDKKIRGKHKTLDIIKGKIIIIKKKTQCLAEPEKAMPRSADQE